MRLQWNGPHNRIRVQVGTPYSWHADNAYVQDVDEAELIADLLTLPNGEFTVHQDDEVCAVVPAGLIVDLALVGVTTLEALASMTGGKIAELAGQSVTPSEDIRAWVEQAQELLDAEDAPSSELDAGVDPADEEE